MPCMLSQRSLFHADKSSSPDWLACGFKYYPEITRDPPDPADVSPSPRGLERHDQRLAVGRRYRKSEREESDNTK